MTVTLSEYFYETVDALASHPDVMPTGLARLFGPSRQVFNAYAAQILDTAKAHARLDEEIGGDEERGLLVVLDGQRTVMGLPVERDVLYMSGDVGKLAAYPDFKMPGGDGPSGPAFG